MLKRKQATILAALAAGAGLGLVLQVQAGAEKVSFPENYAAGVKYLVVDKPAKQVHEFYAQPAAIEAARQGKEMPDGTVFIGVHYNAQLDGDGNPVKGPDGRFIKTDLRGYAVMEKRSGWGAEYPEEKRNGNWEYRYFSPDKTPNEKVNLGSCFGCHKPLAQQDFVFSYENLKAANSK